MNKNNLPKNLPDTPGVYLFKKRRAKTPLYIGKATSLRDRVRSYFSGDIGETRGPSIQKMLKDADVVEVIKTDSVLEALLLETELIKKFRPKHNTQIKDDKTPHFIVITREKFPAVHLMRGKELVHTDEGQFRKIFGPFPHGGELKEALKIMRRIFPWRDEKCIPEQGKPCFNRQIGLCPGVCTGEVSPAEYAFTIQNLERFLSGKKKEVLRSYEKEMKRYADAQEFEKARTLRNKIFSLKHIHDIALLKREGKQNRGVRIEGYDIAHMAGHETVGVMVALSDGVLAKSEYRKFIIRSGRGVDDTGNLQEVLTRRLRHTEWPFPQLVVIDGGKAQYNAAQKTVDEFRLPIKIVSVIKDERHKPSRFLGSYGLLRRYKNEIILANYEAHRYAISFHKARRNKAFFT